MKEKSLYRIIILMSVLFYPVVTMASLKPACSVIKVNHNVIISSDNLIVNDLGDGDLTPVKLEAQVGIFGDKNSVSLKTVIPSKPFHLHFLYKNISNAVSLTVTHDLISNAHCSTLFTGVRLI